ncbi:O-methyltransferase [Mycolicibacterium diernhoferi]|uniref:Methyltransferase n=1 Tax=Mycolicibacterium diernhoferi TaxID=1801 RepID=A0A1Q4HHB3_9MYCO|nr:O-methyltransferase [Mycolicibacterium diernhoferi]OJZ66893.1 methyltransferase [Mycolicibacterium diernhoferi]OPE50529.1 methyltransferase [Mycolicibacterium diernhoferi]PEG51972.1 O-methyltransferase [Mycolicibacterium diernhoferi]QYL23084.1 O-methyltransferase [Mycolicibacterium diernhoferi]
MTEPAAVDRLFDELLHTEDEALRAARESTGPAGMPAIEVSPQHGHLLSLLARISGARRVLEIGTLAGYSTICLARGTGPDGRVVTCEYEPRHAEVARVNLVRAGLGDRVEVIVGAALDTLATLDGPFDMFFIDADKENNPAYVEAAIGLAAPGALIVVDNVTRNGRVLDPAPDDLQATAVRDTLAMMGEHPRLDTAAIQTVGVKGWDGFAVAVVT